MPFAPQSERPRPMPFFFCLFFWPACFACVCLWVYSLWVYNPQNRSRKLEHALQRNAPYSLLLKISFGPLPNPEDSLRAKPVEPRNVSVRRRSLFKFLGTLPLLRHPHAPHAPTSTQAWCFASPAPPCHGQFLSHKVSGSVADLFFR
jgi:hypothetical protein